MKHALLLLLFVAASARAQSIDQLPASSNAYFMHPENVRSATVFTVRRPARTPLKASGGTPIYLQNRICQVSAYEHLFSFGQTPAPQLTSGQKYVLLHVRTSWEDAEANIAHVRISLGSFYANPRVLMLDCNLRSSDPAADLNVALQGLFEIR